MKLDTYKKICGPDRHTLPGIIARAFSCGARLALLAAAAVAFAASPSVAESQNVEALALTRSQALRGAAVLVDGVPMFVQLPPEESSSDIFFVPAPGADRRLQVSIIADSPADETQTIVIPVSIEDKTLARGVSLNLVTPMGNAATVNIPPRRVFLSIPFTIPVTESVHPDFGAPGYDHLIVQVVPKITKKAQVTIDNTATDGLVADIRYEGAAYLRLKDLLNRTNRRDMDGTFFIGKSEDARWHIITENLFEKFDKRNLGVMRDQRLSTEFVSSWRLDNLDNFHAVKFGANLAYKEDNKRILVGNIDRRVKDRVHVEANRTGGRLSWTTRFEGVEVYNPPGRGPVSARAERFGWQLGYNTGNDNSYIDAKFGNLKLQDLETQGEIDDYFNFTIKCSNSFGRQKGSFSQRKFSIAGTTDLDFYGVGSATWLQGEASVNAYLFRDYLAYVRLNNDFARITGRPRRPVWESMFLSFMRTRNYFNAKDSMAKYGLESLFVDVTYQREGKGSRYEKTVRLGLSKYLTIMRYDIPVELFFETDKIGKYRPGAAISIRSYL